MTNFPYSLLHSLLCSFLWQNDLVGIPWKEERDLRKAIYDSLREQQVISSHSQRSVTRQSRLRSKRVSASARKPGIASLGIEESGKIEKVIAYNHFFVPIYL